MGQPENAANLVSVTIVTRSFAKYYPPALSAFVPIQNPELAIVLVSAATKKVIVLRKTARAIAPYLHKIAYKLSSFVAALTNGVECN